MKVALQPKAPWRAPEKGTTLLFPKQQMVLDFIRSSKTFPSEEAIAKHMGWKHAGSARDCLLRLKYKGCIEGDRTFDPDTNRISFNWRLTNPETSADRTDAAKSSTGLSETS